jgi:hypothetical protein
MVVSRRGRVCLRANRWQIDLARCCVARGHERIPSRVPAWDRDSPVAVACCRARFRSSSIVHLRRDSIVQAESQNMCRVEYLTAGGSFEQRTSVVLA